MAFTMSPITLPPSAMVGIVLANRRRIHTFADTCGMPAPEYYVRGGASNPAPHLYHICPGLD